MYMSILQMNEVVVLFCDIINHRYTEHFNSCVLEVSS